MREARIFRVQEFGAACMSVVPRPRGGDWLDDEIRAIKRAGVHLLVSMLTPDEQADMSLNAEAECCHAAGLDFLSVPIPDFGVPSDPVPFEDGVVHAVRTLSQGQSVAVHCRQSIGRSGLFTCAVLVAMGMPLEKAVTTASEARGVPVPESPEQRTWLTANAPRLATLVPKAHKTMPP
jgi:hypothetical protein